MIVPAGTDASLSAKCQPAIMAFHGMGSSPTSREVPESAELESGSDMRDLSRAVRNLGWAVSEARRIGCANRRAASARLFAAAGKRADRSLDYWHDRKMRCKPWRSR